MKNKTDWRVLVVCFVILALVGLFGALAGGNFDDGWYNSVKPSIAPPNWIFGPVWTILYVMIALSLYFAWVNSRGKERKMIGIVFGINLIANGLWSYLFFNLRLVGWAFVDLFVIWISILAMIFLSGKIDRRAGWLLLPYLIWVSFAGVLNYLVYLKI